MFRENGDSRTKGDVVVTVRVSHSQVIALPSQPEAFQPSSCFCVIDRLAVSVVGFLIEDCCGTIVSWKFVERGELLTVALLPVFSVYRLVPSYHLK